MESAKPATTTATTTTTRTITITKTRKSVDAKQTEKKRIKLN